MHLSKNNSTLGYLKIDIFKKEGLKNIHNLKLI